MEKRLLELKDVGLIYQSKYGETEAVKDFCLCNAFKYIWRTKNKNGIEDIDKAIWYLNKYKELTMDKTK